MIVPVIVTEALKLNPKQFVFDVHAAYVTQFSVFP